jgi:uncharacterized protein YbcI
MATESPPDAERPRSVGAEISRMIVQTLHEYAGRGPTKAQTTIGRNSVHCILGDTMTQAERTLADAGHGDEVLQARRRMQDVMRPHLVIEVEKLMERKVIAFMSDNHIDPDFGIESFVFEPQRGDNEVSPDDFASGVREPAVRTAFELKPDRRAASVSPKPPAIAQTLNQVDAPADLSGLGGRGRKPIGAATSSTVARTPSGSEVA